MHNPTIDLVDWWNRVVVPRLARERAERVEQGDDTCARQMSYQKVEDSDGDCLPVASLEFEEEEEGGAWSFIDADEEDRPHDG